MKVFLGVTIYLKNFLRLTIFSLMLVMGGFTALALSPVSVEDYNAYKQARDNSIARSYSNNGSRVAGIADEQREVKFENLLEAKQVAYSYRSSEDSVELDFEVKQSGELELLAMSQVGPLQKLPTYIVTLVSNENQTSGDYALAASEMAYMRQIKVGKYEVRLGREGAQKLRVISQQIGKFSLNLEKIQDDNTATELTNDVQSAVGTIESLP
jgi:hypothetical protein